LYLLSARSGIIISTREGSLQKRIIVLQASVEKYPEIEMNQQGKVRSLFSLIFTPRWISH
jgi:hypothetical protein